MRKIYILAALSMIMLMSILTSNAAVFIVTTNISDDVNLPGTLRWAMHRADTTAGADTIVFNVPGPLPIIITILQPLSLDSLMKGAGTFIDGSSQPPVITGGMSPKIIIRNPGPVMMGLNINPPSVKICGLYFTGFKQVGILISPSADHFIIGDSAKGNVINNITIPTAIGINVNAGYGKIQGNMIGVDTTGQYSVPTGNGIVISGPMASNTTIGGSNAWQGNVISGQTADNKNIFINGAKHITIQANHIGTDLNGHHIPASNARYGIYFQNRADSCQVGGELIGQGNIIGYNIDSTTLIGCGITVDTSYYVTISGNGIYCNGMQGGIALINSGNNMLPAPIITLANSGGAMGAALANGTVELFYNNAGCTISTQACSGAAYIGSCVADGLGTWVYNGFLDASRQLVATSTDPLVHNTSQFSQCANITFSVNVPTITPMGTYSIYPNPFNTATEIRVDAQMLNNGTQLIITDVFGRTVRNISIQNTTTSIAKEDLTAGIYFYQLITNNQTAGTGKLIIQ